MDSVICVTVYTNSTMSAPRTEQSSNRHAWYCIFQVFLLVKCSCVIVLIWLPYLMNKLERVGLGTGYLS
jgi:hypothetical protein